MDTKNAVEVIKDKSAEIYTPGPMEMAQSFLSSGGDIASLEKMMELQEKYDSMQAKKAYTKAMAEFKKNPPVIFKDKQVGFKSKKPGAGSTNYKHATLGNVTKKINTALAEHGLSAAWPLDQTDKGIEVTCTITHEMGHSESTSLFAASDNTGNKNSIQAIGSTVSYLQRYTVLSLTGLATEDQDDDAISAGKPVQYLSEKQCVEIREMIKSIDGLTEEVFLKWAKKESIEAIPESDLERVKIALKARSGAV